MYMLLNRKYGLQSHRRVQTPSSCSSSSSYSFSCSAPSAPPPSSKFSPPSLLRPTVPPLSPPLICKAKAYPMSAHPSALSDASYMPLCAVPAAEMLWQRKARRLLPPPQLRAAACCRMLGGRRRSPCSACRFAQSDVLCEATASAAACRANRQYTGYDLRRRALDTRCSGLRR